MPSDLDILMSHVETINAKTDAASITDRDIAVLVAYHRHNRARRATGYKPRKPEAAPVDVLGMIGAPAAPTPKYTPGSVRRI